MKIYYENNKEYLSQYIRKYYIEKENKMRLYLDEIIFSMHLLPFYFNRKDRLGTFDYFTFNFRLGIAGIYNIKHIKGINPAE